MGLRLVLSPPARGQEQGQPVPPSACRPFLTPGTVSAAWCGRRQPPKSSLLPERRPTMPADTARCREKPGVARPGSGRATLPSLPPPDSWPAQAAAAAPPRPSSAASPAPGRRRTVGTRMMLGDNRGKAEEAASGLGYSGEHIGSVPQAATPAPAAPHRGFPRGHSPALELPATNKLWVWGSRHHQLPSLLGFTTGPAKPLPAVQDGDGLHPPPRKAEGSDRHQAGANQMQRLPAPRSEPERAPRPRRQHSQLKEEGEPRARP